jgi:hypothetical protein
MTRSKLGHHRRGRRPSRWARAGGLSEHRCRPFLALSSKTNLNMICSKISSPAAHQDCVGSDSTTAQLHCSTSVQLVSRTNVGRRLAREASSRWHATETRVHLPGACNVHTVLNNLVTFPAGTNDTEVDQRRNVRACLAPLASGSTKERGTSNTTRAAGSTVHTLIPVHGISRPSLKPASDDQEHSVPRLWLQPTASLHLGRSNH